MSLREQLIEFVMNRTLPSAQNFEKDKWASLEDIDVSNLIRTHCSDVTNTNNDKRLHMACHLFLQWEGYPDSNALVSG